MVECLLCLKSVEATLKLQEDNYSENLEKLSKSFAEYCFQWVSVADLPRTSLQEGFPHGSFCSTCYEKLIELNQIRENLNQIEQHLNQLVTNVEKGIIESYKHCEESFDEEGISSVAKLRIRFQDLGRKVSQNQLFLSEDAKLSISVSSSVNNQDSWIGQDINETWTESNSKDQTKNSSVKRKSRIGKIGRKRLILDKRFQDPKLNESQPVLSIPKIEVEDSEFPTPRESLRMQTSLRRYNDSDSDTNRIEDENEDQNDDTTEKKKIRYSKRNKLLLRCTYSGCSKVFKREALRYSHIRHDHEGIKKQYPCEKCDLAFKTHVALIRHLKAHEDGSAEYSEKQPKHYRKYNCPKPDCDHSFSRTNHLKEHLIKKHDMDPVQIQQEYEELKTCPVCSIVVKSQTKLDIHLEKHRPLVRENKFECDLCGKKYRDANNLRNHKASHRLDKPYVCDQCGFATKRSYQLARHVEMVHIGTRTFLCTECGVSFKKKQHLRDHELTHNALEYRPFTCTIEGCTKAYRSRRNLRQHLEAHTGCKFQCETCGRIFTRKDNLKVHVDTVHLGKPGRTQKEKVKPEATTKVKRLRKSKLEPRSPGESAMELVLPDGDTGSDTEQKIVVEKCETIEPNQLVIVDERNIQQLQQQTQHYQILTNSRIIQQTTIAVPGQGLVTIPHPNINYGDFYYTI